MPNWKPPGPDLAPGFWLKNFSSLHERVRFHIQFVDQRKNFTVTKNKINGNVASNCTGVIADQIYAHLDQEKLLPEEQKGCRKGSRRTNDLLYIDRELIKEVKSRNKNLEMA